MTTLAHTIFVSKKEGYSAATGYTLNRDTFRQWVAEWRCKLSNSKLQTCRGSHQIKKHSALRERTWSAHRFPWNCLPPSDRAYATKARRNRSGTIRSRSYGRKQLRESRDYHPFWLSGENSDKVKFEHLQKPALDVMKKRRKVKWNDYYVNSRSFVYVYFCVPGDWI